MQFAPFMQETKLYQVNLLEISRREACVADRAKKLEIQIVMFIIQNNLPFSLVDELVNFIKFVYIDKNVQDKLKRNRTKCTAIICNVLCKYNENGRNFKYKFIS